MPTLRQKKAVKAIVENHGVVSKGMIEAGYSPNTAKNPKNLTESDGWKELMEKHLDDKKLAKVHEEGLKAITPREKKPDFNARHKYLETAYKIKGKLNELGGGVGDSPSLHVHFHDNEKVLKIVRESEDKIEKELRREIEKPKQN